MPKPKPTGYRNPKMPVIEDDDEFNIELPAPVHTCKVFGPFSQGPLVFLDDQPRFKEVPAEVENLEGR